MDIDPDEIAHEREWIDVLNKAKAEIERLQKTQLEILQSFEDWSAKKGKWADMDWNTLIAYWKRALRGEESDES